MLIKNIINSRVCNLVNLGFMFFYIVIVLYVYCYGIFILYGDVFLNLSGQKVLIIFP